MIVMRIVSLFNKGNLHFDKNHFVTGVFDFSAGIGKRSEIVLEYLYFSEGWKVVSYLPADRFYFVR